MITAENIRRAMSALWDNDIRPDFMFSDYRDDLEVAYEDAVENYIENGFDPGDFDGESDLEDVANDILSRVAGYLDDQLAYDAPYEWVESHVIWTSDILTYYENNPSECDEQLGSIDITGYDSISDIVSACVTLARGAVAHEELQEMKDDIENLAYTDNLKEYLA